MPDEDNHSRDGLGRVVTRRKYLKTGVKGAAVAGFGAAAVTGEAAASSAEADTNPVSEENRREGDDGWLPTAPGGTRPTGTHPLDVNHHVEGYPSATSVAPGESLDFHVSTAPAATYRIDVYRLGWYDGAGARKVASLPEKEGEERPIPDWDRETGLVECDWPVTDTLDVPKHWVTGAYIAQFVATGGEYEGESTGYVFAVREREDRARTAKTLVQLPIATSQAYNGWGGKSLYGFTSTEEETAHGTESADVVSFDRPIGGVPTLHMRYAIHALRFLERERYDVSYVTDVDVHRNPEMLRAHDLIISSGHDEYWSMEQRDGFEAARDGGTNVAFLAANTALWQVRFEDDGRTMVGYKENVEDDPLFGTQDETGLFRSLPDPRPECELLGVMGTGAGLYNAPDYAVVESALDHHWFDGTGFEAGDEIVGCIGHEWDYVREDCDVPGELTTFFHYEEGTSDFDWIVNDDDADAVAYRAPSGALVFSTGTLGYTWRIDPDPTWDQAWPLSRIKEYKPEVMEPDPRLQQFTRNAMADLRRPNPPADGWPSTSE